jgi:hypothetical protein
LSRTFEEDVMSAPGRFVRRLASITALCVAWPLASSGCTGTEGAPASPAAAARSSAEGRDIAQPSIPGELPAAPESDRVDTSVPIFSNPGNITNPLFPVSQQESVLMLGRVDGEPFRAEVTLLPETRIVEWEGQQVEVLVSQYAAFLDGRIEEIAYDLYAQADDGSVWYFGEDVFDFRDGVIVVTEGTWLAGRDGPAAMIMPADPHVGDVYRPENAPGFVFEEVTVKSVTETLDGPLGPIEGGMVASELHMDGSREEKTFAPGYGEFYTAGGPDVEALALAVPTDASDASLPAELTTLTDAALSIVDAAGSGDWRGASDATADATSAWRSCRTGEVPNLIEPRMDAAIDELVMAVDARSETKAANAAIDVARFGLDLQLRFRPVEEVDLSRLDLWAAQLMVDEAAGDDAGVAADAYALDYVRDRILDALDPDTLIKVDQELGAIQIAVLDEEPEAAARAAARLREIAS